MGCFKFVEKLYEFPEPAIIIIITCRTEQFEIIYLNVKNFIINNIPSSDNIYKVKDIEPHLNQKNILIAYIEDLKTKQGYLINIKGLELIYKPEFITEEEMKNLLIETFCRG